MVDDEQIAILIYNHVVQLSLIDYKTEDAFRLAHQVAAMAFDLEFTRIGIEAARHEALTADDVGRSDRSGKCETRSIVSA